MKPAVAQDFGGFLWTVPVAGENIRPAHDNFVVLAEFHLDAADRWSNAAGLDDGRGSSMVQMPVVSVSP